MKLVIDVPKEWYDKLVNLPQTMCYVDILNWQHVLLESRSLSEVIDELSAEVVKEIPECKYEDDYTFASGLDKAIEVISKYRRMVNK